MQKDRVESFGSARQILLKASAADVSVALEVYQAGRELSW
jgi:hypothetical protein